jgi:hypothetical protein
MYFLAWLASSTFSVLLQLVKTILRENSALKILRDNLFCEWIWNILTNYKNQYAERNSEWEEFQSQEIDESSQYQYNFAKKTDSFVEIQKPYQVLQKPK